MKKYFLTAIALLGISVVFVSCLKDTIKKKYTIVKPVYALKQDVYNNIHSNAPQEIKSPGKMFLLGDYIYLTEKGKGIHIIDKSNPNDLVNISFIPIPGNQDVVVKDNILYADCSTDLLVLDITQPNDVVFNKYLPNVFPDQSTWYGYPCDSNQVIVDWVVMDTVAEEKYLRQNYPLMFEDSFSGNVFLQTTTSGTSGSQTGMAGSSSRFSIVNNYLYAVTTSNLKSFNISNPTNPSQSSSNQIGWNIETIYPFNNYLFIGSQSGMFIYNVTNPANPQQESVFVHATQCDPVIADEQNAYITLRSGTQCQGFTNQLDVVNIDNVSSPSLVKTLPLTNPRGLSKDENLLFICDGSSGLRILDATNPSEISVAQTISVNNPNDVIAWNNIAYVSADDGLYLFDYTNYPVIVSLGNVHFNR